MFEFPKAIEISLKDRIAERRRIKQAETRQQWLDDKAIEKGSVNTPTGASWLYWIVPSPGMVYARENPDFTARFGAHGGLNGYAHFVRRPVTEPEEGGILAYVKVHGGITFWGNHDGGVVYGFDTGHYDSNRYPITDPDWVRNEIVQMKAGIDKAAEVEAEYLTTTNEKRRIELAQSVADVRPGEPLGFGAILNLLGGKV